jgi:asparagine synthase (glutamine-hydrolysing)
MCGIAGLVRFDGGAQAERTRGRARAMRAALRHRGPDGEGEALLADAILEHTRLALLDRVGGAQPMSTPDGRYTIVYNGEVYNHSELRGRLSCAFRTRSDAETVLAAFVAWGPECVRSFNGMFAFFVWDAELRRGFAARDPLGVKPLAYAWDGLEFAFASEAHVVARAREVPVRAHAGAILEYLVAPCFSGVERPMFDGVEYLPPGHWLELGPGGPTLRRYYRFTVGDQDPGPGDAALREGLDRAVRRACRADEDIGVFLSGGLDSTAIAALAARALAAPPPAFTIAFAGMAGYDYARSTIVVSDDLPYAELAARALGSPLTIVQAPRGELAADLERIAATNDALPAWEQELAQDRLARAAAATGLKAVLVGDAADETHFGYHFLLDPAATASPRAILERFGAVPVRRDVLADPLASSATDTARGCGPASVREQIAGTTALIVERWLPRLLHNGDIHGMRVGLEARVPFADIELLALAAAVSPTAGLADGEKTRLRGALRGVVPEAIRTRRKSALPKDQGAAAVYQPGGHAAARRPAGAGAGAGRPADALRPLLDPSRPLGEWERAALFRVIVLCHFSRITTGSHEPRTVRRPRREGACSPVHRACPGARAARPSGRVLRALRPERAARARRHQATSSSAPRTTSRRRTPTAGRRSRRWCATRSACARWIGAMLVDSVPLAVDA